MFQVLLPLLAPVVDVFAVYGLVFLAPLRILGLWTAFLLLQVLMGLYAFRLDGERPGPLWSLPLQQFVYRQLMYLVVIQSVFTAVAGSRLRWQRMERYGSLQVPVTPSEPLAAAPPRPSDPSYGRPPAPGAPQVGGAWDDPAGEPHGGYEAGPAWAPHAPAPIPHSPQDHIWPSQPHRDL
ncbi:hypothetical protein OG749_03135 [Streptomyces nojiriensis]|uniref:hypothetical protein n=1 Tax=Streptomyces nojiriensis TaxID=66374 RepID=UPI002E198A59